MLTEDSEDDDIGAQQSTATPTLLSKHPQTELCGRGSFSGEPVDHGDGGGGGGGGGADNDIERMQQKYNIKVMYKIKSHFSTMIESARANYFPLLGTAGAWFLLDIVFYGNGLFAGQVTQVMGFAHDPRSAALAALLMQALAFPGNLCSILFAPRIGLRRLQMCGFAATAVVFMLLSVLEPYLLPYPTLYVLLYGASFFAQNFGPNTTTYILPSLLFPTKHRASCHGISAAMGKLGALLGAQV